jgi:hypothetical protein
VWVRQNNAFSKIQSGDQDGMAAQLLKTAKTAAAPVISIVWTCGWFYCVRSDEPVISYMKKKFGGRNPGIWALV